MNEHELLADVAHEFQTPLAILRGNIEILASLNAASSAKRRAATIAQTAIDGLSRLVANLLKTTHVEPIYAHFDITALLEEVYYDCALLAEDAGISFSLWIADDAEAISLCGDRDKLKEVLLNLLSNALKHTPSGGDISLAMKKADGQLEIMVADTGSGIAPENLPHIFERLYTIPAITAHNAFINDGAGSGANLINSIPTGHGLGLYLSKRIVEAHDGAINVASEPGQGSRFTITLPLAPPAAAAPESLSSRVIIEKCKPTP
jgi:signal transduction histidine kinase